MPQPEKLGFNKEIDKAEKSKRKLNLKN